MKKHNVSGDEILADDVEYIVIKSKNDPSEPVIIIDRSDEPIKTTEDYIVHIGFINN